MDLHRLSNVVGWLLVFGQPIIPSSQCFSPPIAHLLSAGRTSALSSSVMVEDNEVENDAIVRSPMRFLGPYPTMPLRFPNLATASQRERNVTGISLDWVLDTAANVNTINAQVAQELGLEKVGEAPGGVGAAGGIMGGDTFMLGDCEMDIYEPKNDADEESEFKAFTFMKELTASALPVASPAAAGLLGLAFFYCFEGGVEFVWGNSEEVPSVAFYGNKEDMNVNGMARVPFESLPGSMLPSVTICINGKEMPALFDTGSPITVLNKQAAEAAGIATTTELEEVDPGQSKEKKSGWNPFSKLAENIRSAQEIAKATASGDILTIAGAGGNPVRLIKTESAEKVDIKASMGQEQYTTIGTSQVYVGDLPGLAALGGLGGKAPPAAVLGMDLLRCRPKVVFRAQQNEIYL
eukprot:CAMPEP_0172567762 /NCGR_PEP_ID=MMETSP1067-20121228/117062_1 /TAXON_ID=265564 ORGANISM="Thalassiosira punctigera, Strain Tpunct2005C2" /NCGR_SAMPLE_ID=MMETSP1067 /ASSEMBLY_ACC=CAM_ASM_000444 /LENGTH=407 /DNA_ID=CAMNT_0013359185 /DNA_START=106 /DNA_END=1329 /DNA_ORIENTATION=+